MEHIHLFEEVTLLYMSPHCFTNKIYVNLSISCSLEGIISYKKMYLSKLEAQLVTSTLSEKNLWGGFWSAKSKFLFWHFINPVEKKIFFHENPVEVRSFDGIE
jgi:hypothetical protein